MQILFKWTEMSFNVKNHMFYITCQAPLSKTIIYACSIVCLKYSFYDAQMSEGEVLFKMLRLVFILHLM